MFDIEVVLCIYVFGSNENGEPSITCGFVKQEDGRLTLPSVKLGLNKFCSESVSNIISDNIQADIQTLDVVQVGFFDRIVEKNRGETRNVVLAYKTHVLPGTPVNKNLVFYTHKEIEIIRNKIQEGHYEAYRIGFNR